MPWRTLVIAAVLMIVTPSAYLDADIYRWDTKELIPGTEGVTPGPGAQLDHRELAYAELYSLDLSGARFDYSNLTSALLTGSTLANANLTQADVKGAYIRNVAGFTHAQLASTKSYQSKDLQGIDLSGNDLSGWDLSGQNLTGANLFLSNLTNANLSDAIHPPIWPGVLANSNLSSANLTNTRLYLCEGLPVCKFPSATDFTGANLTRASLTGDTLFVWTMSNARLAGVDLRGANWDEWYATNEPAGANMQNTILADGAVQGINLAANEQLVVRDYDGRTVDDETVENISINVLDHMTLSNGGALRLAFDADTWGSTISFEPDILVHFDGTLELSFASDVDLATQLGRTLHIFDWTGVNPTGQFHVAAHTHGICRSSISTVADWSCVCKVFLGKMLCR